MTNTAQAVIRITIDDGEPANGTTSSSTASFTLDLRDPAISSVASSTTVTTSTVTWTTDINSNTLVDYGTSTANLLFLYASSSEETTSHSAELTGLEQNTTYYFQVRSGLTTDNNSGSYYTLTTEPDTTAPELSNATATAVDLHSGTITWTTDEKSSSQVIYSPNADLSAASSTSPVTDLRLEHSVILPELDMNTSYYFAASSSDAYDNSATSSTLSLTTNNAEEDIIAPEITVGPDTAAGQTTTTISWTTDESANSIVDYGLTEAFGSLAGDLDESVTSHSVELAGLTASTSYYYQARSQDSAGNSTTSASSTFTTAEDTAAPAISNIATTTVSYDSATIVWDTDEDSIAKIEYGETASYGSSTSYTSAYTTRQAVSLTGLDENTTYHYAVYAKDSSENEASSSDQTFTTETVQSGATVYITTGGSADTSPPQIVDIEVTDITETSARITWSTTENASSRLDYGRTASYGLDASRLGARIDHQGDLANLTPGISYHFRIRATDLSGNTGYSSDQTFATLGQTPEDDTGEEPGEEPAAGEETEGTETTTEESILSSITNASRDFINDIIQSLTGNPLLEQLEQNEEELFIASVSEMVNRAISPPTITRVLVEAGSDYARISWSTDKQSNSSVAYAPEDEYEAGASEPYIGFFGKDEEATLDHEILLPNLKPSTTYHFQARSASAVGPEASSADASFTTSSLLPEITGVVFREIGERTASLAWETTLPTKTSIEITDTKTGEKIIQQDPSYLKVHELTIADLGVATNYALQLLAEDEQGNISVSSILNFSTVLSPQPPVISQVRINTALVPGRINKVQAIISWKTDKPASSQVRYAEGIDLASSLSSATPLDDSLVLDHIVITTAFKPGSVYRFQTESVDALGNVSRSQNYTILTPEPEETVLDLIIDNFQETFQFLRRLQF